ncbi:hypothetical protein GPALN_006373 [Globodera pallida]|nr:hypothetical protein GPALN_006373 [Globodera pallida]
MEQRGRRRGSKLAADVFGDDVGGGTVLLAAVGGGGGGGEERCHHPSWHMHTPTICALWDGFSCWPLTRRHVVSIMCSRVPVYKNPNTAQKLARTSESAQI